jgi:hypothetical protein
LTLRLPGSDTLNNLASICSRSVYIKANTADQSVVDAIVQSVHDIRRSISMQSYLSFMISSVGIKALCASLAVVKEASNSPAYDQVIKKKISYLDYSLNRSARLLFCSGQKATKVLEMVLPQLSCWLEPIRTANKEERNDIDCLVKARSSIVILTYFALGTKEVQKDFSVFDVISETISKDDLAAAATAYLHIIVCDGTLMKLSIQLAFPLFGLLYAEPEILLQPILGTIADWFSTGKLENAQQVNVLSILLQWCKSPTTQILCREKHLFGIVENRVAQIAQSKALSNYEPARILADQLSVHLEILQGTQKCQLA